MYIEGNEDVQLWDALVYGPSMSVTGCMRSIVMLFVCSSDYMTIST